MFVSPFQASRFLNFPASHLVSFFEFLSFVLILACSHAFTPLHLFVDLHPIISKCEMNSTKKEATSLLVRLFSSCKKAHVDKYATYALIHPINWNRPVPFQ